MSEIVKKNLMVCVMHGCKECSLYHQEVPEDCGFFILHLLETAIGGEREMPRQSGKTRALVSMAGELLAHGLNVYYITETEKMADLVKGRYRIDPRAEVMGWSRARRNLRERPSGAILVDELMPEEMARLRAEALYGSGHAVVAHYWTNR